MINENEDAKTNLLLQLVAKEEELNALYDVVETKDRELEQLAKQLAVAYSELTKLRESNAQMREISNGFQAANIRIFDAVKAMFRRLTKEDSGYDQLTKEQQSILLGPINEFLDEYIEAQESVQKVLKNAPDGR